MAYDPGLAQALRDALADMPVAEKKMFGGLAFLLNGHMVCGVHKGGADPARRHADDVHRQTHGRHGRRLGHNG